MGADTDICSRSIRRLIFSAPLHPVTIEDRKENPHEDCGRRKGRRVDPRPSICGPGSRSNQNRRFVARSEEHTSELQSHLNLVCRLLLEKKKTKDSNSQILVSILQSIPITLH